MAKELKQSIEELTAWVEESKDTRGVIILAAENLKIHEDGATECDASICVAGQVVTSCVTCTRKESRQRTTTIRSSLSTGGLCAS